MRRNSSLVAQLFASTYQAGDSNFNSDNHQEEQEHQEQEEGPEQAETEGEA